MVKAGIDCLFNLLKIDIILAFCGCAFRLFEAWGLLVEALRLLHSFLHLLVDIPELFFNIAGCPVNRYNKVKNELI